jgi:hypothetical protein
MAYDKALEINPQDSTALKGKEALSNTVQPASQSTVQPASQGTVRPAYQSTGLPAYYNPVWGFNLRNPVWGFNLL